MSPCRARAGDRGKRKRRSGKLMTQEARSAAPSRKKNRPTGRQDRRPRPDAQRCCRSALPGRRAAAAAGQVRKGAGRCWRSCFPKRRWRFRTAAGCTSSPAGGKWKRSLSFQTPEEHYDYAISQLNTGYYEEAREQFDSILTGASQCRLCVLRAGGAGSDHRARAGLPEQPGTGD